MPKTYLPELKDAEARGAVADAVAALFERWQLHEVNQAELLALRTLTDLHQGGLRDADSGTLERAGHLLAIDRALHRRFGDRPEKRERWIHEPNYYLHGETPLAVMLINGLAGIRMVRDLVESRGG